MNEPIEKKPVPRDPALRARFWRLYHRSQGYGRRYIPPGLRFLAGFLLIVMGLLGFLPVLGFWMIPLGIAIAALDVKAALILVSAWWQGWRAPTPPENGDPPET